MVWAGAGQADGRSGAPRALLDNLVTFIAANKLQGVTIDFENVPPADHKNLEMFLSEMSAGFRAAWLDHRPMAAPFDDDHWPYKAYADIVDYTMLMAYDEADDSAAARRHRGRGLV